jgi:hypothetical protein
MKSLFFAGALAAAWVPTCSPAQDGHACWGPAKFSASAPNPESRDSITMLSNKDTAILLAAAAKRGKRPAAGIVVIYTARYSEDQAKVLVFAFNEKGCLVDRGAIPINEWREIFGAAM